MPEPTFIIKKPWGESHYFKDDRAKPHEDDKCPNCQSAMVYASESYEPAGELYYCPVCKTGWLEQDKYKEDD